MPAVKKVGEPCAGEPHARIEVAAGGNRPVGNAARRWRLPPTLHELQSSRVHLAGISANPNGAWVTQQARNLLMRLEDEGVRARVLIRDRDSKFTAVFDEVFRSEGLRLIKAPIAAPRAKAHAERWVGSPRRECLDRILIVSRRQLETVLREYVAYYNTHRPHRSLDRHPPLLKTRPVPPPDLEWRVRRRDRLGGLLHEYELAA